MASFISVVVATTLLLVASASLSQASLAPSSEPATSPSTRWMLPRIQLPFIFTGPLDSRYTHLPHLGGKRLIRKLPDFVILPMLTELETPADALEASSGPEAFDVTGLGPITRGHGENGRIAGAPETTSSDTQGVDIIGLGPLTKGHGEVGHLASAPETASNDTEGDDITGLGPMTKGHSEIGRLAGAPETASSDTKGYITSLGLMTKVLGETGHLVDAPASEPPVVSN